ncbi:MAG: phosphatidate cytidylyltransferase [Bacteroidia bacterium]
MNNFWQRTLTGFVFVLIIVASTLFSGVSYLVLLSIINTLCLYEFFSLVLTDKKPFEKYLGVAIGTVMMTVLILIITGNLNLGWLYHIIPLFGFMFIIKLFEKTGREFETLAYQILGIIYLTFPLAMLADMGYYNSFEYAYSIPLGFFILHWSSDTFAYIVGRAFGRTKLFERISPKKTIEGSFGALIITIGIAYLLSIIWDDLARTDWMMIAAIIVVFGTFGDLMESLLKRNLGIKDSGKILPGHGGVLDRFDGFFLSVPFVYFYLLIIQ